MTVCFFLKKKRKEKKNTIYEKQQVFNSFQNKKEQKKLIKNPNMLSYNIFKCLLVSFAPYGRKIDCLILTKLFIIVKICLNADHKDLISF